MVRRRRHRSAQNAARRAVRGSSLRAEPSTEPGAAYPRLHPIADRKHGTQNPHRLRGRIREGGRVRRITGLDWPLVALAACLLASALAGAILVDHFDDRNVGVILLVQSVPYALA